MEIIGKVYQKQIAESGEKDGRTWVRQTIVVEQLDTRGQRIALTVIGDKNVTAWIDINVGDIVRCKFEPRSREHEGRWFSELQCTYVQKLTPIER